MDIKKFKEILSKLIEKEENKVILIKGDWGVGKTYYINNFLSEFNSERMDMLKEHSNSFKGKASDSETIKRNKIIRVSLFGLKTTKDITDEISKKFLFPTFSSKTEGVHKDVKQVVGLLASIPFIARFIPTKKIDVTKIETLDGIYRVVIFIDDVERSSIDLNDIFGYIDSLKNNPLFKVIIAINEDKKLKGSKELWITKEKVVDAEVRLSNTKTHVIKEIFSKQDSELVIKITDAFSIVNLRIIFKIKHIFDHFIGLAAEQGINNDGLINIKASCIALPSYYYSLEASQDYNQDDLLKRVSSIYVFDRYNPFNAIINSYLDSQTINFDTVQHACNEIAKRQDSELISRYMKEIEKIIRNSFSENDKGKIIELCNKVLSNDKASDNHFLTVINTLISLKEIVDVGVISARVEKNGTINKYVASTILRFPNIITDTNKAIYDYLNSAMSNNENIHGNNIFNDNSISSNEKINSLLNQIENSYVEYWKDQIIKISVSNWVDYLKQEKAVDIIDRNIYTIIKIINSEYGENLKCAIKSIYDGCPLNRFRLEQTLRVNLISIVEAADNHVVGNDDDEQTNQN